MDINKIDLAKRLKDEAESKQKVVDYLMNPDDKPKEILKKVFTGGMSNLMSSVNIDQIAAVSMQAIVDKLQSDIEKSYNEIEKM